jgi:primosomal protein N'
MPLIKCHECSGQVSDHARTCPHCGAPVIATIKRRQKAYLIELGIRLAFAAIIIIIISITFHRFMNKALAPLKAMQQQQQPH